MILEEIKNIKSDKKELKKFGLTIGNVLLIISAILFYYSKGSYKAFSIAGVLLVLSGMFIPKILLPLQKIWMALAVILGWFSTRIILGILFYLIMTPIKFTAMISGKKFLDLEIEKNKNSYWQYRERKQYDPVETERQF